MMKKPWQIRGQPPATGPRAIDYFLLGVITVFLFWGVTEWIEKGGEWLR